MIQHSWRSLPPNGAALWELGSCLTWDGAPRECYQCHCCVQEVSCEDSAARQRLHLEQRRLATHQQEVTTQHIIQHNHDQPLDMSLTSSTISHISILNSGPSVLDREP